MEVSYILTFWEERGRETDTSVVWRFSLQDPHTGRRRGFASLEALAAALQQEIARQGTDEKQGRTLARLCPNERIQAA